MKTIITTLAIFISGFALSQNESPNIEISEKNYNLEDVSLSITVNSKEDLEVIDIEKFETFFEDLGENEPVSIEFICERDEMNSEKKSTFKIKVSGNSNDKPTFFKRLKKIKKNAFKIYNTKTKS